MLSVGGLIVAGQHGGVTTAGLYILARTLPSGLLGVFAPTLVRRVRLERVLFVVGATRVVGFAVATLVLAVDAPIIVFYVVTIITSTASPLYRSVHAALLPSLCRSASELTAVNIVRGLIDSVSGMVGPAIVVGVLALGHLVAANGLVLVFGLGATISVGFLLISNLSTDRGGHAVGSVKASEHTVRQIHRGLVDVFAQRNVALLICMYLIQTFTLGAVSVFWVGIAFNLLHVGESAIGVFNTTEGIGSIIGSIMATTLLSSRRLGIWFGIGLSLWGLPLIVLGLAESYPLAIILFAIVGLGNAPMDTAGYTLLQRLSKTGTAGSVLVAAETLATVTCGLGAVVTPLVLHFITLKLALILFGCICPSLFVLSLPRLRAMDRFLEKQDQLVTYLQSVQLFSGLPFSTLQDLSARMKIESAAAGREVIRQGEPGDSFYIIKEGTAEVLGHNRVIAHLKPGDFFGEIALLRDIPRTATVHAQSDLTLYVLHKTDFIPIINAYKKSLIEAESTIDRRLATFHPSAMRA